MNSVTTERRRANYILALIAIGAVLGVVAWWFLVRHDSAEAPRIFYAHSDFKTYSSVGDLLGDADLVIVGTTNGITGRDLDYGTDDPDEKQYHLGSPIVYYEVAVNETLKGNADGETIIVVRDDPARVISEDSTPLDSNHKVVLFLEKRTYTPGITTHKNSVIYVPISMDSGVFDVADNAPEGFDGNLAGNTMITPRMQREGMFGTGTTFTMAEVRQAIP